MGVTVAFRLQTFERALSRRETAQRQIEIAGQTIVRDGNALEGLNAFDGFPEVALDPRVEYGQKIEERPDAGGRVRPNQPPCACAKSYDLVEAPSHVQGRPDCLGR